MCCNIVTAIQLCVFIGSDCNNRIVMHTMENVKFILILLSKFQAPFCIVLHVVAARTDRQTDRQTPAPPFIVQIHLTMKQCRNHA